MPIATLPGGKEGEERRGEEGRGEERRGEERVRGGGGKVRDLGSMSVLLNVIKSFSFEFCWYTHHLNESRGSHTIPPKTRPSERNVGNGKHNQRSDRHPSFLPLFFLPLILKHIILHNTYSKWSYPFLPLPRLLPLFDSQENPTNVFNALWCIIYQTGCWYGKRTRGR